ncbi:MAG: hypothetical protein HY557_01855 [Euryarchaeota archaeon]|nr:hypothetical protein [Euryarchaeota archaeon]
MDFPTREVREGRASLLVPDVPYDRGPGRRTLLPFYNPTMAVARDLTILVMAAALPKGAAVLDGLAATGVLGIRAALETGRELAMTWNDKLPAAHGLIVENAQRNGVAGEVLQDDLRLVLSRRYFHFVDVDPFGTAVPFVDAAFQQSGRGSVLAFTATDTAPLAGTYPRTCWRRYGARSLRTPCGAETALRIFLGYLVRVAASHDRGVRPLLAFAAEHFLKAWIVVDARASVADAALAQLGYVRFEGARFDAWPSPPEGPYAGPLWLGPLADPAILTAIAPQPDTSHAAARLLERIREGAALPPFFYENHAMAQTLGVDPVPISAWIEALRAAGFRATRTQFTANGVRTEAPWPEVVRTYRDLQQRTP